MIDFISTSVKVPDVQPYGMPCATYYLVKTVSYPPFLAMYLEKDGEAAWYSSYHSKVIVPVIGYCLID